MYLYSLIPRPFPLPVLTSEVIMVTQVTTGALGDSVDTGTSAPFPDHTSTAENERPGNPL